MRCWSNTRYASYTKRLDVMVFFIALQGFYCGITDIEAEEMR